MREGEEDQSLGGLLAGDQANKQACMASSLCPLDRFGPGDLGLEFGLSCDARPFLGPELENWAWTLGLLDFGFADGPNRIKMKTSKINKNDKLKAKCKTRYDNK